MTKDSLVIQNISLYAFSKVIDTVAAIAVVVLIARYLGPHSYGKYAFITNLIFLFVPVFNFGLSEIVIRELAKHKGNSDEFFGTAVIVRTLLIVVSAAVIIIVASQFGLSGPLLGAVGLAMISEFFLSYTRLNSDVFVAYERMGYDTFVVTVNRLSIIVSIILAAYYDLGLIGIFLCLAVVNFLTAVLGCGITVRRFIKPQIRFKRDLLQFIVKAAFPVALSLFLVESSIRLDIFILKVLGDFNEIAFFGAPLRLVLRLSFISIALVTSLYPIYSRLATSSHSDLFYLYEKTFKILFAFILPVCIFTTFFADRIIVLIFGTQFVGAADALQFLIWMGLFLSMSSLCGHILISLNKQKVVALGHTVCFITNLILTIILVPLYGYVGASFGKLISFGILFLVVFCFVSTRLGCIPLTNIVVKPVISSLLMISLLYLGKDYNLFLLIFMGSCIYFGGLYGLRIFSYEEVVKVKEIFKTA